MSDQERRAAQRAWEANPEDPALVNAVARAYERDALIPPGWISSAQVHASQTLRFSVGALVFADLPQAADSQRSWWRLDPGNALTLPPHQRWFVEPLEPLELPTVLQDLGVETPMGLRLSAPGLSSGWAGSGRGLRWLSLARSAAATDELPRVLGTLGARLSSLRIQDAPGLSARGLASLSEAPRLGHLWLEGLGRLYDDDLAVLAQLDQLAELKLVSCRQIQGPGLAHLASLPWLRRLSLEACTGVNPWFLAALPALRHLALPLKGPVNYEGLRGLSELRSLFCQGTGIGLDQLHALPLEHLRLGDTTTRGLIQAAGFSGLRTLEAHCGARVGDKGLQALSALRQLRHLKLGGRGSRRAITSAGLSALSKLPALEELELETTLPTSSLARLLGAPSLRALRCDAIEVAALPSCEVSRTLESLEGGSWHGLDSASLARLVAMIPQLRRLSLGLVDGLGLDLSVLNRLDRLESLALDGVGPQALELLADHPSLTKLRASGRNLEQAASALRRLPKLLQVELFDTAAGRWTRIGPDDPTPTR